MCVCVVCRCGRWGLTATGACLAVKTRSEIVKPYIYIIYYFESCSSLPCYYYYITRVLDVYQTSCSPSLMVSPFPLEFGATPNHTYTRREENRNISNTINNGLVCIFVFQVLCRSATVRKRTRENMNAWPRTLWAHNMLRPCNCGSEVSAIIPFFVAIIIFFFFVYVLLLYFRSDYRADYLLYMYCVIPIRIF